MTETGGYRIGIDVGGTFTDFVLADSATDPLMARRDLEQEYLSGAR